VSLLLKGRGGERREKDMGKEGKERKREKEGKRGRGRERK